ncbi:dual specificity phosphatase DUPD1-like [Sinocyclocheilus anshuiensis]|uniref:dual specificity phosphatase DUPD1-like n=1 Tax=Sinocyclocheilus anshuiensis TaxID=1608454 RepID=UPI0007B8993F|nr:PREDICTED: dual specificity phosphatase DUPD1-like [Sinocyclocheilus anshuiensis]
MSTEKMKSWDLKGSEDLTEPAGCSSASPATTEKTSPTGPEEEPQGKTELQNMFQLKQCLEKCALDWTPVTEVWPNVFIGNEETAMDRARLKEMGITHILNTVAVKKKRRVLLGIPRKDDLLGKANIGVKYYKGMNISYYGVPVTDDHLFDISKYFYQAAKFIHKALSNTESKVLVHCLDGVRRSSTLVVAYLMTTMT